MTGKIKTLEEDLFITKREKDKAMISNKDEIKGITDVIVQMRSKMHQILKEKRYRQDRIKELEEKIEKSKVKHPSP